MSQSSGITWQAMRAVAEKLGIGSTETVRLWVRQAEIDGGTRPGATSEESDELKRLRRENAELKRENAQLHAQLLHLRRQIIDQLIFVLAFLQILA